jgi:RNA polymerase sigma-70 factor (ECF subfamily)
MPLPEEELFACLAGARAGSKEALGRLLESYRAYLLLIAQSELDPELRTKEGASDLVQETFLEAQRDFGQFHGDTEEELLAWLRRLLRNNLVNVIRHYRDTIKRQISREVSLDSGTSASPLRNALRDPILTPGEQAASREQGRAVLEALARLPADYRQVLLLRFQDGCGFAEIGRRMGRSTNAAQKLCVRALEQLQEELSPPPAGPPSS